MPLARGVEESLSFVAGNRGTVAPRAPPHPALSKSPPPASPRVPTRQAVVSGFATNEIGSNLESQLRQPRPRTPDEDGKVRFLCQSALGVGSDSVHCGDSPAGERAFSRLETPVPTRLSAECGGLCRVWNTTYMHSFMNSLGHPVRGRDPHLTNDDTGSEKFSEAGDLRASWGEKPRLRPWAPAPQH